MDYESCPLRDSIFTNTLKLEVDEFGKIVKTYFIFQNDTLASCNRHFKRKAFYMAKEIEFVPAKDPKNIPIAAEKYFQMQTLDSLSDRVRRVQNIHLSTRIESARYRGCEYVIGNSVDKLKCSEFAILKYLYRNMEYPLGARRKGVEGQVVVRFDISPNGWVQNVRLINDIGSGCGSEVIRVVNKFNNQDYPPFIPARTPFGTQVQTMELPVSFYLKPK